LLACGRSDAPVQTPNPQTETQAANVGASTSTVAVKAADPGNNGAKSLPTPITTRTPSAPLPAKLPFPMPQQYPQMPSGAPTGTANELGK
jgi:hypothetical protein